MNETITHETLKAIITTLSESDPSFADRLAPRLEAVAQKADRSGWKHDAELARKLVASK